MAETHQITRDKTRKYNCDSQDICGQKDVHSIARTAALIVRRRRRKEACFIPLV